MLKNLFSFGFEFISCISYRWKIC